MRRSILGLVVVASMVAVSPATASPVITSDPAVGMKTGAIITFSATDITPPANPTYTWDLDGDGVLGDKQGSVVTWSYGAPGPVKVTVRDGDGMEAAQVISVVGPSAAFVTFPAGPVVGEVVRFAYSSTEAVDKIEWDMNGDGTYGDLDGPVASRTFPAPGVYAVGLRVTGLPYGDMSHAVSTSTQLITVNPVGAATRISTAVVAHLMSPFPVVRITGKVTRRGARIKRLTVRAPYGSTVAVRCHGRGCPFKNSTRTLARGSAKGVSTTIRIRKLEQRLLRGGSSVKVFVSRQGEIGKYTRFTIRKRKPPVRNDLCLPPGSSAPAQCPAS
jgi:hypothetical protein